MRPQDRLIAKELKERLAAVAKLVDFRVFGSRARGNADEYSDMDVFLEVESLDGELKERIQEIVWEVGFENYLVISSLIFTRDEIENSPLRSSPIVRTIAEEGMRIRRISRYFLTIGFFPYFPLYKGCISYFLPLIKGSSIHNFPLS